MLMEVFILTGDANGYANANWGAGVDADASVDQFNTDADNMPGQ